MDPAPPTISEEFQGGTYGKVIPPEEEGEPALDIDLDIDHELEDQSQDPSPAVVEEYQDGNYGKVVPAQSSVRSATSSIGSMYSIKLPEEATSPSSTRISRRTENARSVRASVRAQRKGGGGGGRTEASKKMTMVRSSELSLLRWSRAEACTLAAKQNCSAHRIVRRSAHGTVDGSDGEAHRGRPSRLATRALPAAAAMTVRLQRLRCVQAWPSRLWSAQAWHAQRMQVSDALYQWTSALDYDLRTTLERAMFAFQ